MAEFRDKEEGFLGRTWRLAKTVALTGAVISSAPLLLPPLLLASTVSFAFAIPFGVYFAGYACTEKVMASLVSPSSTHVQEQEEEQKELLMKRKDGEELQDMKKAGDEEKGFTGTFIPVLRGFGGEKRMQKEIDAIRVIIGCKEASEPSWAEEVNNLFQFLGIEPPISSEDFSNMDNVEHHLHLLKSIVGVK
ncbi:uncharacterized protein LOC144716335 [Wolffia australiana]